MTSTNESATPAWLAQLRRELDVNDLRATTLIAPLSLAELNRTPRPGAWSAGQCLEHLCITNEVYLDPIRAALSAPATGPVQQITPGWFARWFIRSYIEPSEKTKRAPAPAKIAPQSHVNLSVLSRFTRSNELVRELASAASSHDVNHVRFANPFAKVKVFTVGTGFEIIWKHQQRHLLQAERALAAFK